MKTGGAGSAKRVSNRVFGAGDTYGHQTIRSKVPVLPRKMGQPFIKRFIEWWTE